MISAKILGTGIDLVDIRRIDKALNRFEQRFIRRIYTPAEQMLCEARGENGRVYSYARRWAAKEACAKALGVGLVGRGFGISSNWLEIEIISEETGQPLVVLHGSMAAQAAALAKQKTTAEAKACCHISMTDEPPYAQAIALLEAVF